MSFVDTHCHLNLPEYQDDLDLVINNALSNQVNRIIIPSTDLASSYAIIDLCEKYASVFGAVGIHPEACEDYHPSQRTELMNLLQHPKMVAVGEVGLDCFHRVDNLDIQLVVFQAMLEIAQECRKPVIIHSRNCLAKVNLMVKESYANGSIGIHNGVFHSFEGDLHDSELAIANRFVIGAGGPITYKNASKKHELFSKIELEKVVIETDGPYLPPQSHRGRRNEPAFIPEIASRLAELQQCNIFHVSETTTKTACDLFLMD